MSRRIVGGALFAVILSALAGCGGSGPDTGLDPTPTASSTGPPAAEGTGAEVPAPGGGGKPAIEAVGLPIGISESEEEAQCFLVRWSTGGFPYGARVTVPDVDVMGGKKLGGGCGGLPSCKEFTFKPDTMVCTVKLEIPPGGTATVSARGKVTCSGDGCETFRNELKGITPTIEGPTEDPTSAPPTTESAPAPQTQEPQTQEPPTPGPPIQPPDVPLPTE